MMTNCITSAFFYFHVFIFLSSLSNSSALVLVGGFTLSDLLDKPWSQVSSLLPGTRLHFYGA